MAMWRNGYSPLPCHDKRPAMDACQNHHETNAAKIHLWDRLWPYDRNAGCLTRNTPTRDVDITDRATCRAVFDRIVERFEEPLASPLPAPKQCGKTTLLDILTLPRCAAAVDREHIHGSSVSRYRGDAADAALAPKPRTGRRCGRQPRSRRGWAAIDRASSFQASRGACTGALMSAGVKSMRPPSRSRGAVFGLAVRAADRPRLA
jgi:hypothetical protein